MLVNSPTKPLKSVAEFLQFVQGVRDTWSKVSIRPLKDTEELWFRGENSSYVAPLVPRIYRNADGGCSKGKVLKLLEAENQYCEEFKKWAFQFCANPPEDDWEWYFLMQHHNVPTRLLDWSDGALIALHFAVYRNQNIKGNPRVYILDPTWLDEYLDRKKSYAEVTRKWRSVYRSDQYLRHEWERTYLYDDTAGWKRTPLPDVPLVLDFYNTTRRIAAQRSRFVLLGTQCNWLTTMLKQIGARLTYVDFDHGYLPEIEQQLTDAGITESVIFPDMDGVGREIEQHWKSWNEGPSIKRRKRRTRR